MSRLTPTLCAVFLLASALPTASAADVLEIVELGPDGNAIYYTVQCTDGTEATVVVNPNSRQTCATKSSGEKQCGSWRPQDAAKHVCRP